MNSDQLTSLPSESPPPAGPPLRVPRSLVIAAFVVVGIWLNDLLAWNASATLLITGLAVVMAHFLAQWRWTHAESFMLGIALLGLGASLWAVRNSANAGGDIGQLAKENQIETRTPLQVTGTIANIPALDVPADSLRQLSSRPQQVRTLFLLQATSLKQNGSPVEVRGTCRVLVEGDGTNLWRWGDQVELTGQIDLAQAPGNPGEFDYAQHLYRSRISVMMFVKHPAAVAVLESHKWNPRVWMSDFRQHIVALLRTQLSAKNRATAEALLLGNRGHLPPELERDFVASGTMHLLAISGLHVGILYVFLVRVFNVLLLPRTRSLILAGSVCLLYCLLTDLRPSVTRATLFIVLHIFGQLICRDIRMGSLIGTTILILVAFDPSIAFDVGAWLSFLAVGALGWISDRTPPPEDRSVPLDILSWQDRVNNFRVAAFDWLLLRYRQMLAVTMLSAPLVASQFHVVSLTGMIINVLLIPLTGCILIAGFVFIAVGAFVPPVAFLPGVLFQTLLSLLNGAVAIAGDVRFGFITIPDLPGWFLPAYYLLLIASAAASHLKVQQTCRLLLLVIVIVALGLTCTAPTPTGFTCTMLSVGHGNAVVVETDNGKLLLFDAGALNRGERTSDLICRFLWRKGYRMIDTIVISHPDADHYNAVTGLLDRMPVGNVVISSQFCRSEAVEVKDVLNKISSLNLKCDIAVSGDRIETGGLKIEFLQADLNAAGNTADNASSLVAVLRIAGRCICLPGDLEGQGQQQLLSELPQCDLLLSPHHGSPAANQKAFATRTQPQNVVVSARDDRLRNALQSVYESSTLWMTSEAGAVSYQITADGATTISSYAESQTAGL